MIKSSSVVAKTVSVALVSLTIFILVGCGTRHHGAEFFDSSALSDNIREGIFVMTEESYSNRHSGICASRYPLRASVQGNTILITDSIGEQVYKASRFSRFDDDRYFRGQEWHVKVWLNLSFEGDILNVRRCTLNSTRDYQFKFYAEIENASECYSDTVDNCAK